MRAIEFLLPQNIEIISGSKGPMFIGTADNVFPNLVDVLRQIASYPLGTRLKVGQFTFVISQEFPLLLEPNVVTLPPDAWGIFASKAAEIATGREESPFYFGECGFLWPRPEPDIGIQLLGNALTDVSRL